MIIEEPIEDAIRAQIRSQRYDGAIRSGTISIEKGPRGKDPSNMSGTISTSANLGKSYHQPRQAVYDRDSQGLAKSLAISNDQMLTHDHMNIKSEPDSSANARNQGQQTMSITNQPGSTGFLQRCYRRVRPKSSAGGGFRAKPLTTRWSNRLADHADRPTNRLPTTKTSLANRTSNPQVNKLLRQSVPKPHSKSNTIASNNLAADILNFDAKLAKNVDIAPKTHMDHQFLEYIMGLGIAVNPAKDTE